MNATNVQMGEWLGQRAQVTDSLRIVEEKLAPTVIKWLISLGLQRGEIDAGIIPESDRVLRVIRKPGTGLSLVAKPACPAQRPRAAFAF